jgi:hypothetical protein
MPSLRVDDDVIIFPGGDTASNLDELQTSDPDSSITISPESGLSAGMFFDLSITARLGAAIIVDDTFLLPTPMAPPLEPTIPSLLLW